MLLPVMLLSLEGDVLFIQGSITQPNRIVEECLEEEQRPCCELSRTPTVVKSRDFNPITL